MLSHGMHASPFIHGRFYTPEDNHKSLSTQSVRQPIVSRTRSSAPASKTQQLPGAGTRANTRQDRLTRERVATMRREQTLEQNMRREAMSLLKQEADQAFKSSEKAHGAQKLALLWKAQALASEVARIFSNAGAPMGHGSDDART